MLNLLIDFRAVWRLAVYAFELLAAQEGEHCYSGVLLVVFLPEFGVDVELDHIQVLEFFCTGTGFVEFCTASLHNLLPFVDGEVDVLDLCLRFSLCDEEQGDDSSSAQEESQYLDYEFGVHRLSDLRVFW